MRLDIISSRPFDQHRAVFDADHQIARWIQLGASPQPFFGVKTRFQKLPTDELIQR